MADILDNLQTSQCTNCGAKLPQDCGFSDLCERCDRLAHGIDEPKPMTEDAND